MIKKFEDSRGFTYLSDVYVYIEQFGKKGHQIGRKIGDMLELLTMGYCYKSKNLKEAMKTEIALPSLEIQKSIVEEMDKIENEKIKYFQEVEKFEKSQSKIMSGYI